MLTKIRISGYRDPACTKSIPNGSIVGYINPDNYKKDITVKYVKSNTIGNPQPTHVFMGIDDEALTLGKIVVDGTGVVAGAPVIKNVQDYISNFQNVVCGYNGQTHSTPFLKIAWGTLNFICICKSFSVNYTLFDSGGNPLRAEITMVLSNTTDFSTKAKEAAASSPDLTHLRIFKAGDTLPLMCYRVYGDSSYYLDVAKKNNLDNFYDIKPGTPLYFYPLKK